MNASKILVERIRELHTEADSLRRHAAIIDNHADVMTAALREIDPLHVVEVMGADGKPKTMLLDEISVPYRR